MRKKQFKTESKKMLDMMINSIYTHKEIFLRELISNASDAIDKRYFHSLSDGASGLSRDDYEIHLETDSELGTLKITDNGCGMTEEDLENNLGIIAKSGSLDFKTENIDENIDIIGQFGVGFYSAFMVSDKITVRTKAIGSDTAYIWESEGVDGYTVGECDYDKIGTEITLHIKKDTESEHYSEFLTEYKIRELVRKYSDYIRYPITMNISREEKKEDSEETVTVVEKQTLNSMVPLWRKSEKEVTDEEYKNFYSEKYFDFEDYAAVIHTKFEGNCDCDVLLFIPAKAPYDYYTKHFEKGLSLYSSGVMIMEKCPDLLPDYFNFVRGVVDSRDVSLNISREMLQHDRQLKIIEKAIEKRIKTELTKMMNNDRQRYEKFFSEFGISLKFGLYAGYGVNKDTLQDLIMFRSSLDKKYVTLKEYVSRMTAEQKNIYYACGESLEMADMLPQTQAVKAKGYEVLYLTDEVDEFTVKMLDEYDGKHFINVCADNIDISTEEEKAQIKEENDKSEEMLKFMKEALGDEVSAVKFSNTLTDYPVCLSSEGGISTEMEKVLSKQAIEGFNAKATTVLEININHPLADSLKKLYDKDKDKLTKYSKILYNQARLISGLSIANPTDLCNMVCDLML